MIATNDSIAPGSRTSNFQWSVIIIDNRYKKMQLNEPGMVQVKEFLFYMLGPNVSRRY